MLLTITTMEKGKLNTHSPIHCMKYNWDNWIYLNTPLTQCNWQAFYNSNVFRYICIMMIMRCYLQTNEYDYWAVMYIDSQLGPCFPWIMISNTVVIRDFSRKCNICSLKWIQHKVLGTPTTLNTLWIMAALGTISVTVHHTWWLPKLDEDFWRLTHCKKNCSLEYILAYLIIQ